MHRLIFVLMLSGCWPRIPGTWEDWDTAEVETDGPGTDAPTQIVGGVEYVTYLGDYWGGWTWPDEGAMWWGWLESPEPGVSATEMYSAGLGCWNFGLGQPDFEEVIDRFEDLDADTCTVVGPKGAFELTWRGDGKNLFAGENLASKLDEDESLDLEEATVHGENLSLDEFAYLPEGLDFSPNLDTQSPLTLAADELVVTWNATDDADYVAVAVITFDEGAVEQEMVICLAEIGDQEIEIPEDIWDNLAEADDAMVYLETWAETIVDVPGTDSVSRILGVHEQVGWINIDN